MTRTSTTRLGVVVAAVVLAVDQASKFWVLDVLDLPTLGQIVLLPVLNLTMVWNTGVTFGLLHSVGSLGPALLAVVALVVVSALMVWLRRAESPLVAASLGAIAGGAVGNVADRLRFGAVVDFIHAHAFGYSWYVFNLADAAIVCGVAALLVDNLRPRRRAPSDLASRTKAAGTPDDDLPAHEQIRY